MARKIDTDAEIDRIRMSMQFSHPSNPDSGYDWLYVISGSPHGGLYLKDPSGRQIGPFITGSASASSDLLSVTSYNPGTNTTTSTTSTAGVDVDATNLAVTFTVPASGKVLVRLTAVAYQSVNGAAYWWCLRTTGGANVAGTRGYAATNDAPTRTSLSIYITGLTPGASQTYRWGHGVGSDTGNIRYGDDAGNGPFGPAVIEVWSAP
jgi:hypothetical protein